MKRKHRRRERAIELGLAIAAKKSEIEAIKAEETVAVGTLDMLIASKEERKMAPFLVETQQPDGTWEAKCIAKTEEDAQNAVKAGRVMRRIQGVKIGEWRIVFVPKEGWS